MLKIKDNLHTPNSITQLSKSSVWSDKFFKNELYVNPAKIFIISSLLTVTKKQKEEKQNKVQ